MKEHRNWVYSEKHSYYARRSAARDDPDAILSLIIDGADQIKYHLPHFGRIDHDSAGMRLPCLLTGCISHGGPTYCYLGMGNLKQGTNLTIEVMFQVLMDLIRSKGRVPPICYLQLDNTAKQCKSKFMVGWCGYLVGCGAFEKIILSFLPVGHTHEDIDGLFGNISEKLSGRDAVSREAMKQLIATSCQTQSLDENGNRMALVVVNLDHIANFSGYIEPYLVRYPKISKWHQFEFTKVNTDEGPNVKVRVRLDTSSNFQYWSTKHARAVCL